MESFSINGVVQAEYKYNYLGQQAIRTLTQTGQVINSVYGPDGNRMAEFEFDPVAGSSSLLREYIWFKGKPVAVVEGGVVYFVRSDHIGRPVFATDGTGAKVWEATYLPFGGVHTSSGSPIALRFPGQWFQSESGLHQNWMRDYDPTTGRYIQADPLGLVDGASVYGYVGQNPGRYVDPRGLASNKDPMDPNSPFCKNLQRKMQNYRKEIQRMEVELQRGGLPESFPNAAHYQTMTGHRYLLKLMWKRLMEAEEEFFNRCGGGSGCSGAGEPEEPGILNKLRGITPMIIAPLPGKTRRLRGGGGGGKVLLPELMILSSY